MLHNPNWDKAKTSPLLLDNFIAWLQKQPADEKYDWLDSDSCLAAQYSQSIDREYGHNDILALAGTFSADLENIAYARPWNFGAALNRAKALKAMKAKQLVPLD